MKSSICYSSHVAPKCWPLFTDSAPRNDRFYVYLLPPTGEVRQWSYPWHEPFLSLGTHLCSSASRVLPRHGSPFCASQKCTFSENVAHTEMTNAVQSPVREATLQFPVRRGAAIGTRIHLLSGGVFFCAGDHGCGDKCGPVAATTHLVL